jgi:hypothetical protein
MSASMQVVLFEDLPYGGIESTQLLKKGVLTRPGNKNGQKIASQ